MEWFTGEAKDMEMVWTCVENVRRKIRTKGDLKGVMWRGRWCEKEKKKGWNTIYKKLGVIYNYLSTLLSVSNVSPLPKHH